MKKYELDGVNIEWCHDRSLLQGKAEKWLNSFSKHLKNLMPKGLIIHSPKASYFDERIYRKGGYSLVNKLIGSHIDFYNVKYYRDRSDYDNYFRIFESSSQSKKGGVAVKELIAKGIPSEKIVVGKPLAENVGGWVKEQYLGLALAKAYYNFGWFAGVGMWEYFDDFSNRKIKKVAGQLEKVCRSECQ